MLEEQVMKEMKTAMLGKNEPALRSLRAIKAAIIIAKTSEGAGGVLKEEDEVKLLQKLVKQRKDSLEIYTKQGRPELAAKEKEEIEIIERFLPAQLSNDELTKEIEQIIKETGASTAADMGKVIGQANSKLGGRTDGKTIAAKVKELLTK